MMNDTSECNALITLRLTQIKHCDALIPSRSFTGYVQLCLRGFMEVLNNQTVYKCSFCIHKTFTKKGMKLHEEKYCKGTNSPHVQNCEHEDIGTAWVPMRGEGNRMEPDYDYCRDCGFKFD